MAVKMFSQTRSLLVAGSGMGSGWGEGGRGVNHESRVKFLYIQESCYLLKSFHESRYEGTKRSSP